MTTGVWAKQLDFDNNSNSNSAWEARRKYFGEYLTKEDETQSFVYSSAATFLITELTHFLPSCSFLSNIDITVS